MRYRRQRMARRKPTAVSAATAPNRAGVERTKSCRLDSETDFAEEQKQR